MGPAVLEVMTSLRLSNPHVFCLLVSFQLANGAVWVQFNDGSQLLVQAGVSSVSYTAPSGHTTRYSK